MSHGAYGSLLYDDLQHSGSEDVLGSGVGRDSFGGALNVHAFECRCVVDDADALAVIAFQSGAVGENFDLVPSGFPRGKEQSGSGPLLGFVS